MADSTGKNPVRFQVPVGSNFDKTWFEDADEDVDVDRHSNQMGNDNDADKNKRNLELLFHSALQMREDGVESESSQIPSRRQLLSGNLGEEDCSEGEDDDDSDFGDDNFEFYGEKQTGPNSQQQHEHFTSEELFRKFVNKIKVEKYEGVDYLPSGAGNKIITASKKQTANRMKVKDKQDRATVEQVMDPRTRMILFKLLSSGKVLSIDGCISTGKEANVYHATGPEGNSYAIKIFKTSILTFKARDKYVSGEFRFRQGYCKKNPRKMVRLWAEKEYRNLLRIHSSGTVLVPQPRLLKSHVLVMDFIGSSGWPCPLLKDVKFDLIEFEDEEKLSKDEVSDEQDPANDENNPLHSLFKKLYRDALLILYRLYKHCKLVHADFSEFNLILKDNSELYVIDVSQSVEHDHPRSFDFLRSDIKNIQDFFGKRIPVGDFKEIFEFITSPTIDDTNYLNVLEGILQNVRKWEYLDVPTEVFRQTFIPRKMDEVEHYERDYNKVKQGQTDLVYTNIMGMKPDLSGPMLKPECNLTETLILNSKPPKDIKHHDSQSDASDSGDEDSNDSDAAEGETSKANLARSKDETPEQRKERKKLVKQEKAEKRLTKVKKHVKKRQEKLSHHNSKRK